jgi:hypothetical protein
MKMESHMQENLSALGRAALKLAQRGFAVFPLAPGSKKPVKGVPWRTAATHDASRIFSWWDLYPSANIAVATGSPSGVAILDIDIKNGHRGLESLAKWEREFGPLPVTLTASTASGGQHRLFAAPRGIPTKRDFRDGLELLGEKSYVVVAPSVICKGPYPGPYVWLNDAPLADIPASLVEMATMTASLEWPSLPNAGPWDFFKPTSRDEVYAHSAMRDQCIILSATPVGRRMETLNVSATKLGSLVAGSGLRAESAIRELFAAAEACGLVRDEGNERVLQVIRRGLEAGRRRPRSCARSRDHLYAAIEKLPITRGQRGTLTLMTKAMHGNGTFTAGAKRLAEESGRAERAIRRDFRNLIKAGLIRPYMGRPSGKGKPFTNFVICRDRFIPPTTPTSFTSTPTSLPPPVVG